MPAQAEQRPHDPDAAVEQCRRRHAGEPRPLAARRAHGKRLGLIVARVAGKDDVGAEAGGRVGQEPVARLAGRSAQPGPGFRPAPHRGFMRDAVRRAQARHLPRLGGGFRAQAVIDRHGQKPRGRIMSGEMIVEEEKQRQRIAAAGNGNDQPAAGVDVAKEKVRVEAHRLAAVNSSRQQEAALCSCFTRSLSASEACG